MQVEGLTEIDPDPEWRALYDSVEACTEVQGEFDRVTWYRAVEIQDTVENRDPSGAWLGPLGRPYGIAIHRLRLSRGGEPLLQTVRHESIHEILQAVDHRGDVWCRCDGRRDLFPQC